MYDLRIPPGADPELFTPRPLDGEVESFEVMYSKIIEERTHYYLFQLLPVPQVIEKMREGKFKPNCALGIKVVSLAGVVYIYTEIQ